MLIAALVGVIVGFGLAIPPGPITVAVIKQALERHDRAGYEIAYGAAAMDIVYVLVAAFASSALVSTLKDKVLASPWAMLIFQVVCIIVLVFLGIRYMRATAKNVTDTQRIEEEQEARAAKMGISSKVGVGVLISVTNLASPTFLPSLIVLVGYLHANGWLKDGIWTNLIYAVAFGLGTALWLTIILKVLKKIRDHISPNFVPRIYQFAALTFFIFSGILVYHVITGTDWSKL